VDSRPDPPRGLRGTRHSGAGTALAPAPLCRSLQAGPCHGGRPWYPVRGPRQAWAYVRRGSGVRHQRAPQWEPPRI